MTARNPSSTLLEQLLSSAEVSEGRVIDRKYLLRKLVGEGAFGLVYEAEDLRMGRRVALKIVLSHRNPSHAQLLRSEVDLIRSVEHANVVRLYDFGEHANGVLYMCMEFVEGRDLGEVLFESGALGEPRAVHIALQVLDALIETQRQGIVHLDLKPQNIILTLEGARRDVVKLVDFGIARMIARDGSSSGLTRGTPLYMAPEQIRNEALGPHTDVYAMGLVLYEMLAGVPAFADGDALEILSKKATISVRLPEGIASSGVKGVVDRALEREIHKRFADASAMYGALRDALDGGTSADGLTHPPLDVWGRHGTGTNFVNARPSTAKLSSLLSPVKSADGNTSSPGEAVPSDRRRRTMEMSAQQLSEIRVPPAAPEEVDDADTREKLPLVSVRKPVRRRSTEADGKSTSPLGLRRVTPPGGSDEPLS